MRRRFIALAVLACAAGGALGCSKQTNIGASDDSFSSVANGLWALDGVPEHGDIELLQLDDRSYASIVREEAPAPEPAEEGARRAAAALPAPANDNEAIVGRPETGSLSRAPRAPNTAAESPPVSLVAEDQHYTVTETADTLTLTDANGRVLTYRRTYRLYCVPTDRGIEATTIIELGKEPKIVGVNGDGVQFPKAGNFDATVRSDVLFRLQEYVVTAKFHEASTVMVKLPWAEMNKQVIHGTLGVVGPTDAGAPTPISCERVMPTY